MQVQNELDYLCVGVCEVQGLRGGVATTSFEGWFAEQLQAAGEAVVTAEWESRREAVRGLLRRGGFKPSGRSRPAQEYLLRCYHDGTFPRVHPAVDCLNVFSLRTGIPISMLVRDAFPEGLRIRLGRAGESYVFNQGGQELQLEGLIVSCGGEGSDRPLGTPVKDSMAGKIDTAVDAIVCILYGPADRVTQEQMDAWALELRDALIRHAVS